MAGLRVGCGVDEGGRTLREGEELRCVRDREDGMKAEAQTTDENLFWTVYGHRA